MIFRLTRKIEFPDPRLGEPDGLLAIGGDLSVNRLLLAYSYGIFPWYAFREKAIQWWCPMNRFVIFPSEIHISHSMRNLLNKELYQVTFNHAFEEVIRHCGKLRESEEGAWLGPAMTEAYIRLYEQGLAFSVEVWQDDSLAGGLYGVCIGPCFFGESMFSLKPSASKVALIRLAQFMEQHNGRLIDCQFETPHLKSMGGRYITYQEYLSYVNPENTLFQQP